MSSITTMEKKIKQQKIKEKQQKESISSNNNMGNNKNSNKLRLRDTLLNMLGEFVALNKSPEVRLSSASQQFLADAVLEEKRHLDKDHIRHVRSVSSNAVLASPSMGHSQINPTSNSFIHHSRHVSLPTNHESSNRFSLFPPRLRKVAQADDRIRSQLQQQQRQTNVISEENEEESEQQQQQQTSFKTNQTRTKKEGRKAAVAL
ncbi:unnamed protein product [Meloidogyne enterolobii]|uniref:Uncharacterized protein n=2 Tax=Meloidogyne enterolobii TaxID=390850 RepID=A0A6V7XEI2_MELEN|nr:unnamed protein product [Meloidogyne enterolobii]